MRLLFDENLSFRLCEALADAFPGSSQVRLLGLGQAGDEAIWAEAKSGGFILVSLDSDFADMAAHFGPPPKVIWLRCGNQRTAFIATLIRKHAEAIATFHKAGESACLEIY
jgi:predicted nuclease of predicted toxin-antitoxin system